MALGDNYAGAPEQSGPTDTSANPGGFFGTSDPAFGNEQSGLFGAGLGISTGGLFGQDIFGGMLEGVQDWAEQEFAIPFTPGATASPFGTTSWQDGVLRMQASDPMNEAMSGLFSGGGALVGEGVRSATSDFSGLRDEQLGILRELARPEEEQAAASTASRLFSGGALGSTGGANQMQALQEAQSQADLQRQLQAIGLAQQQQQRGLQQAQMGSELFGRGVQLSEPLFTQGQFGLDIGTGRAEARAQGGQIATQRQADRRGFGGDLFGSVMGGVSSMFSDERLKSNIVDRDTGTITKEQADALRSVDFDMFGERHSGVIAQDLEKAGLDDLVMEHESGYKMVDYGELTARLLSTLKEVYAHG